MANEAISMPRDAAEPPSLFVEGAAKALKLLATAIAGEKAMGSFGECDPEQRDMSEGLRDCWRDALDAVQDASLLDATAEDEDRLRQVMTQLASVIYDLDTAGVDPLAWLEVHDLEKSVRSAAPSRALALMDTAMLLLTDYLDLMGVIDIEDRF